MSAAPTPTPPTSSSSTPGELPTATTLRPKHVPERTCVACRRKRPQGELRRVTRSGVKGQRSQSRVKGQGGEWQVLGGHRSGRGAYVCADHPACWQDKKLRRAFGAQAPSVARQLLELLNPLPPLSPLEPTAGSLIPVPPST